MLDVEELFGFRPRSVIVFAVGGGGDAASGYLNAFWLRRRGVDAVLAAIAWERFIVDPCPGPLSLDEFASPAVRLEWLVEARGGCYAVRACSSRVIVPQVCRLARITGESVYVVDVVAGSRGVARSLEELASLTGAEAILAVDVGGDVLAQGFEDSLWSPLADSLGLAGSVESGLPVTVAVQSPGSDGELGLDAITERVGDVAVAGGLRGARMVSLEEVGLLEELVREGFVTEAGLAQVLARRGLRGELRIRGGTRRVALSFIQALVLYLDGSVLYEQSPLARRVSGTWSVWEARDRLLESCVATELDLEENLWDMMVRGEAPDPLEARRRARRVARSYCVERRT